MKTNDHEVLSLTTGSRSHPKPALLPTTNHIRFNRPWTSGTELDYLAEALTRGSLIGDGDFGRRSEALLERSLQTHRVMLTPSCTQALELAALLLDVRAGDEVIVPSFTFVSTVNAFVLRGARPVFVDIRPDTLNLDESLLESRITPNTRVIVPVHYAGVAVEMDQVMSIATKHEIPLVEDNAHGLFARYRGKSLGTFGSLAAQSFHGTKNFSSGEGGALLINDPALVHRAEILREKGTDRARFLRGQVEKYSWVDIGSSYLPSELQAAVLLAQLEARDEILARRRRIWEYYHEHLAAWSAKSGVGVPHVPIECEQSYHMYHLILPDSLQRIRFIAELERQGIQAHFHYAPLHSSSMGVQFGGRKGMCPVTESVSDRLVRLPFYTGMELVDQERVVETIRRIKLHS